MMQMSIDRYWDKQMDIKIHKHTYWYRYNFPFEILKPLASFRCSANNGAGNTFFFFFFFLETSSSEWCWFDVNVVKLQSWSQVRVQSIGETFSCLSWSSYQPGSGGWRVRTWTAAVRSTLPSSYQGVYFSLAVVWFRFMWSLLRFGFLSLYFRLCFSKSISVSLFMSVSVSVIISVSVCLSLYFSLFQKLSILKTLFH